jgi:hypothetical protein
VVGVAGTGVDMLSPLDAEFPGTMCVLSTQVGVFQCDEHR